MTMFGIPKLHCKILSVHFPFITGDELAQHLVVFPFPVFLESSSFHICLFGILSISSETTCTVVSPPVVSPCLC